LPPEELSYNDVSEILRYLSRHLKWGQVLINCLKLTQPSVYQNLSEPGLASKPTFVLRHGSCPALITCRSRDGFYPKFVITAL
jgi:hypothetical protein